jgi:hypothetical protein
LYEILKRVTEDFTYLIDGIDISEKRKERDTGFEAMASETAMETMYHVNFKKSAANP